MKNSTIVLLIGIAIGFGFTKMTEQPVVAGETLPAAAKYVDQLTPGTLIGLQYVEIKEGQSKEEAINYAKNEYWSVMNANKSTQDIMWYVAEVDAGEHAGQLAFITLIKDVSVRNNWWPRGGIDPEEKWIKLSGLPAAVDAANKWGNYFTAAGMFEADLVIQ